LGCAGSARASGRECQRQAPAVPSALHDAPFAAHNLEHCETLVTPAQLLVDIWPPTPRGTPERVSARRLWPSRLSRQNRRTISAICRMKKQLLASGCRPTDQIAQARFLRVRGKAGKHTIRRAADHRRSRDTAMGTATASA